MTEDGQKMMRVFGAVLLEAKEASGLTYEQLAYEADVALSSAHKILTKGGNSMTTVSKVMKALGVTPVELMRRAADRMEETQ